MHERRSHRLYRRLRLVGLSAALSAIALPFAARAQDLPYTFDEVLRIVSSGVVREERIASLLHERCVAFHVDSPLLDRLAEAGAREAVLEAVRSACHILPGEPRWLWIEPDSVKLEVGERFTLAALGMGPRRDPLRSVEVRWTSDDPQVVTADEWGRVLAAAPGMTRVSAEATNGIRASVRIWVTRPAEALRLNPQTAALLGGIVPGGGQFYTRQPVKGLALLGGAGVSVLAALSITSEETILTGETCSDGRCEYSVIGRRHRPLFWPGISAAASLWAYGLFDAVRHSRPARESDGASRGSELRLLGSAEILPDAAWRLEIVSLRF